MTVKELALLAGVSSSTVSKILNGKDENISKQTRDKVLELAKLYNLTSDASRKISSRRSFNVGVALLQSLDTASILIGMSTESSKRGYSLLTRNFAKSDEEHEKNIAAIADNNIDGILIQYNSTTNTRLLNSYIRNNCPSFSFGASDELSTRSLIEQAAYKATDLLIQNGHKNIALIDNANSAPFLRGCSTAFYKNKLHFNSDFVFESFAALTAEIFQRDVTGIVCSKISLACEAMYKMHTLNYSIPNRISLITICSDYEAQIFLPCTGVVVPFQEFGRNLMAQLLNKCEKKFDISFQMPNCHIIDNSTIAKMSPNNAFIVIGSINMDEILTADGVPQIGTTVKATHHMVTPGGKGTNQSICLAKLGANTTLIGSIGADSDAISILSSLHTANVSCAGIVQHSDSQTGKAFLHLEKDGESAITGVLGANALMDDDFIIKSEHLFSDAKFCLFQAEMANSALRKVIELAKKYGLVTFFKAADNENISHDIIGSVDYFIPNQKESTLLCPSLKTVEEQAEFFYNLGAKNVIITLASKGCYLRNAQTKKYFDGFKTNTVDSTGGSDTFIATLAFYISEGFELENAIDRSNFAASLCVEQCGVSHAMIDRSNLERLYKNAKSKSI